MKQYKMAAIILCVSILAYDFPVFGAVTGKVVKEVIETTLGRSIKHSGGQIAESGGKRIARESIEGMVKFHGDDAFKVAGNAGLARRIGPEALELEGKSPGLSKRVFKIFGDDAGKAVAREVPAEDIPRLLKYAEKADTPATREALLKSYKKEGKNLFERIPSKLVLTTGLSASMLYGVHRATEPAAALGDTIRESPEAAHTAVHAFTRWGAVAVIFIIGLLMWRFRLMPWHGKRDNGKAKSEGHRLSWPEAVFGIKRSVGNSKTV